MTAPIQGPTQLTVFLLCCPSGGGKSTYAARLLDIMTAWQSPTVIICPDNLREELTGDINDQSRNHFIFTQLVPIRMNGAHSLGKHIIFDATNTSRKARKGIIEHAKFLGYKIEAHVFHVPIEVCKARNAGRSRVIPEFVIDRQFAQWHEPSLDEGVDRIVEAET